MMTRDECIREYGLSAGTKALVNIIYSDFESRVCKNCKHSEPHYDKELVLMCHKGVCNQILCQECGVTEDFGCMMFERKNNE